MSMPQVSVVIPSYNSAAWLPETLAGALAQKDVELEVIVVDDGSTDNTKEVVSEFPTVRCLSQANAGVAAARNTGIKAARAPYIAFLDADDIWDPLKLQRQLRVLDQHPEVGLVFSNYRPFGAEVAYRTGFDRSRVLPGIPRLAIGADAFLLQSRNLFLDVLNDLFPWTSTLLVRKTAIDQAGLFYERLRHVGEDWLMCMRLAKVCEFAFVDDCLVRRREHAGSNSRIGHHEVQAIAVLEHLSGWDRLTAAEEMAVRQRLAETLFDLGYHELKRGETQSARLRFRRYFEVRKTLDSNAKQAVHRKRAPAYFVSTWLPRRIMKFLSSASA